MSGAADDRRVDLGPPEKVQLLIADFNDRRTEINNRTTVQHVLISLNVTAAGAIAGVVLTRDDPNRALLLLLVPVCTALAMLWADHAETIRHIGWYIRYCIRPLIEPVDAGDLWRWELEHDTFKDPKTRGPDNVRKGLTFVAPIMLIFIGPPLFGLVYAFNDMVREGDIGSRVLFGFAALLFLGASVLLVQAVFAGDEPGPEEGCPCLPP